VNSTTTFWAFAAVFVAIALAFVLPPLLRKRQGAVQAGRRSINIAVYRDQMREMEVDRRNGLLTDEQFDAAKLELEARLAQDAIEPGEDVQPVRRGGRVLGYTLAAAIPVVAFGLYGLLGNPQAISAVGVAQADAGMGAVKGEHDIMKLIQQVEEKTKSEPNNGEAWAMLAKTQAVMERWPEALHAYEKAIALVPGKASVMTGYAEALAINDNHTLKGKPMDLVLKALEIDPEDIKGLELAGIYNFQEKNYARAAYYFKHLYKLLPPDSPYAQDIADAQKEANRLANNGLAGGLDNLSDPGPAKAKKDAAAPGATIRGKVDLAPALKAKVSAKDVVFLFARSATGGAPIAAIRAEAGKFPLEFELNDAMAMNPDNRLSNFKAVTITARVSKTGDVKAVAGDLEGSLADVKVGAKDVKLVIDKVHN
jgi:cytochrome c-type biogenesis protein CcmH